MLSGFDSGLSSPIDDAAMSQASSGGISRFLAPPFVALSNLRRSNTEVSAGTAAASVAPTSAAPGGGRNVSSAYSGIMTSDCGSAIPPLEFNKHLGRSQDLTNLEDHLVRSPISGSDVFLPMGGGSDAGDDDGGDGMGRRHSRLRSDTGFSEAASRYESSVTDNSAAGMGRGADGGARGRGDGVGGGNSRLSLGVGARAVGVGARAGAGAHSRSPTSAAGSRFESCSPVSNSTALSRVGGSPTSMLTGGGGDGRRHHGSGIGVGGLAGGARGAGLYTGQSVASSMRSGSSFFRAGSASSGLSSGGGRISSGSASSWDEEDLQNMGARWLSERAFNQKFEDSKK